MADDDEVRRAVRGHEQDNDDTYEGGTIDLAEPEQDQDDEDTYTEKLRGLRDSVEEAMDWVVSDEKDPNYDKRGPNASWRERSGPTQDESNYQRLGRRLGNYISNLPDERQHGEFRGNEYDISSEDGENIADLIEKGEYDDARGYAQAVASIADDDELGQTMIQRINEIESYHSE